MKILRLSFAVVILYLYCLHPSQQNGAHNITQWAKCRQKRFLIFNTQGVQKLIISLALPIDLKDKRAWRSLSGAWNMQWQHNLPIAIQQWWNSTYFPSPGRKRSIGHALLPTARPEHPNDLTAIFLYAMIESYMNNKGMNGRECMQRAICENAQVHYVAGVVDQIYKRLLTPEAAMEDYYKDSYTMGSNGVDCYKTFRCPKGHSIFDQFVLIDEVK